MMTNLLHGAHVANKLFSTIARLRLLLVMFLTLTISANAWGADVTFATSAYNGKGGASGTGGNATATIDGVTITSTKAYYTSAHIREYSGGTITVSSSSNITKIVFTSTASGTNSNGPGKISLNSGGGSYSYSGTKGTWTGSSTSIKFDCDAQFRWTQVVVTTASADPYTVTLNAGPGTCAASVTEASAGAGVTLPTPTLDCGDWEFAGWKTTSAVTTETTTEPTLIPAGNYKPSNNITLYAVYQRETTSGGGGGNTSVTFTDEDSGGWTTTAGEQNGTKDGVSISTNNGIYSQNNNQLRVYKDATFTVSSENIITSIVFSSSNYEWSSTSNGVYSDKTWTGNTKSVTFTAGNGQVRITQLVVTVSAGGGSTTYYHSTPDCSSTEPTHYLLRK